jgi:membrane protein DedA with SNARE-associated domain
MPGHAIPAHAEHHPPPKWVLWVLVSCVAGLYILGFVTASLTPKLLKDNPLGLIALSPRYRNFLLTWNRIGVLPFMVVGTLRLLVSDPIYFLLGRFYGDGAIRWFENAMGGPQGGGQLVRITEKWFKKVADVLCMFFAGPIVCVLAGAAGVRPRRFFTLDAMGTVVVVLVLRVFGRVLKSPVDWVTKFNAHYWKWLTAVAIVSTLIFLVNGGRAHKRFGALHDLEELDREAREDEEQA